jgi:hypothetical protein
MSRKPDPHVGSKDKKWVAGPVKSLPHGLATNSASPEQCGPADEWIITQVGGIAGIM